MFKLLFERMETEPTPKVVSIAVKQLGLATGKVVVVRRIA